MSERADDFHAFPTSSVDGFTQHGMMLRDYFAAQAMVGLLASPRFPGADNGTGKVTSKQMSVLAYGLADEMLAARHSTTPREQGE